MPERVTASSRSEKSAEVVVGGDLLPKDRTRRSGHGRDDAVGKASDARASGAVGAGAG
jgi:hypothetical protein